VLCVSGAEWRIHLRVFGVFAALCGRRRWQRYFGGLLRDVLQRVGQAGERRGAGSAVRGVDGVWNERGHQQHQLSAAATEAEAVGGDGFRGARGGGEGFWRAGEIEVSR